VKEIKLRRTLLATSETVKTVDFIPEYNILGDIKKISEYDFSTQNAKIVPVLLLLYMDKGSNVLYPEMGLRTVIRSLPFREMGEIFSILESINSHIFLYTGLPTKVYIDDEDPFTNVDKGEYMIRIDIEGVVAPLKVQLDRSKTFFVKHPSIFQGK
jgi:hypothetical protein